MAIVNSSRQVEAQPRRPTGFLFSDFQWRVNAALPARRLGGISGRCKYIKETPHRETVQCKKKMRILSFQRPFGQKSKAT